MGRMKSMPTIMMGKMEMEFPAMYIRKRFIGTWNRGRRERVSDVVT